jgi:copper(I)-binding protein
MVFLEIRSLGAADRLEGASTDAALRVEIHGVVLEGGAMASRPLAGLDIPAGGAFVLEPGIVFLKLIGLKAPLVEGHELELELAFAGAGGLDVHAEIGAAHARQHRHAGHRH